MNTNKKKLIAGNWKMNGSLDANQALVQGLLAGLEGAYCDVAVAVPAPYLAQVQAMVQGSHLALAAQDVSEHGAGAYTGEVSAAMLREFAPLMTAIIIQYPSTSRVSHPSVAPPARRPTTQATGRVATAMIPDRERTAPSEEPNTSIQPWSST